MSMNKKTNEWPLKRRLMLFKLVEEYGTQWTDVAKILGTTAAIARGKYRHTNWEELFKASGTTKKEVLHNAEIDSLIEQRVEPLTAEQVATEMIEEEKTKIISEHENKRAKELLRQLAAEDIVLKKIVSAVLSVPPIDISEITVPKFTDVSTRPEEAVLVLSDLHLGLAVLSEEVGGFSKYNGEIFIKRLDSLIEKVIRITNRHRKACKIETLNIFMLGDNVHGSNNAGQWGFLHTEQTIVDQLFILWDEVERAFLKLKSVFPKMNIHCVFGNHGRVDKRGFEKNFVNWDYILYCILKKGLQNQKGITWSIPRAPFDMATIQGHKFLLIHGDQVKAWSGIPFYGMVRAESKFRALFDRNVDLKNIQRQAIEDGIDEADFETQLKYINEKIKSFDYMILGHFHHMAELETSSGGRIIMNSSFAGGDDYSINTLLTANTAAQKFFGVHPEGKSWSYDIDLDRE